MKKVRHLLPLILLCGMFLSGFSKAAAQTPATVLVYLPTSGSYNDWFITLVDRATTQQYAFQPNSGQYPSGYLGTVPEGDYDVYFTSSYSTNFLFGVQNSYGNRQEPGT